MATLVTLWLALAAHAGTPRSLVAKAARVSDGDTVIAITSEGTKLRLRLLAIDASESARKSRPHLVGGEDWGIC